MKQVKPLKDTLAGQVEKTSEGWGFYLYPPMGEESWQGDFPTREQAREKRRAVLSTLQGTSRVFERAFSRA